MQFNNASSNASQYDWDFGTGSDVSTAVSPLFVYTSAGVYNVTLIVTSATGCKDTSSTTIVVKDAAAAIDHQTNGNENFLLKTIAANEFLLETGTGDSSDFEAVLSDLSGKIIASYDHTALKDHHLYLNLQQYVPGIYLLSLSSEKQKLVFKLPIR